MNDNYKDHEQEYDSMKDVVEFQNNMYNPGHYVGTGKVPPTVSAPGNATPLAVMCFFAAVLFGVLGAFLFFSDVHIASLGLIKLLTISLFFLLLGFGYLKKAKRYHQKKNAMKREEAVKSGEDQMWQRTCPKCGESHDFDYPKCPKCDFDYFD